MGPVGWDMSWRTGDASQMDVVVTPDRGVITGKSDARKFTVPFKYIVTRLA